MSSKIDIYELRVSLQTNLYNKGARQLTDDFAEYELRRVILNQCFALSLTTKIYLIYTIEDELDDEVGKNVDKN